MRLALSDIRTDGGTQPRASIDYNVVQEYADVMRAGAEFPPPVVYYDGRSYWCADGFHRIAAFAEVGAAHVEADVRQGTREDAVWYSCGANTTHGLRRTNADKRRAVETALRLKPAMSNRAIEEHCGVSDTLVADVKRSIQVPTSGTSPPRVTGKDGKSYPAKSGKDAAPKAKAPPLPKPDSFDSDEGRTHSQSDECEGGHVEEPKPVPVPTPKPSMSTLNARDRIVAEALNLGDEHARWIADRILRQLAQRAA